MKTSLLTTPLVLALGLKSVTALPTSTDAAAVKAEEILAPAAVAEKLAMPSTPALGIMEKRTFNPLRGCWKHHCNPRLDKCQKRCDRENPRRFDKEYHQNRQERDSCKDQCYYLLSGDGNWQEMGMEDAHQEAEKMAEQEKEDEKVEGGSRWRLS
ncbi:hypothetical protein BTJ68_06947 [Hortaea werneckii EXF-2000]|uniref:Uncharacterized protein n=1 Tax=Hortaea werneckii EXF-2000 TaxID=1157616 RepID=A0A1Z5TAE8_HORWE|nr:hypothetical protein BTJ68_06947 [Hortaea werneckii EXF-2000]